MPKTTPMIRQYLSIKEKYADAILFYRMGDFYEMFFEDAETASRLLDITLTSRNKNEETPVPMCGVPVRAAQTYIARLLEQGQKVAVCDQVEDPAQAKGLVRREVVRVITPGMIVENEFLDDRSNNYILAAARNDRTAGVAFLDLSTGTFRVAESDRPEAVADEALRIAPSEILLPESLKADPLATAVRNAAPDTAATFLEDRHFSFSRARDGLLEQFKTLSLEGFGCETLHAGVAAAGALIYYVKETQKQPVSHINRIETYALDQYLMIDDVSCRNLELLQNLRTGTRRGTLLNVMDQTVTAMGARLLRTWLRYPLLDPAAVNERLDAVEEARNAIRTCKDIREALKSVCDLERLGAKVSMGHANARDMIALKRAFYAIPDIRALLGDFKVRLFQWDDETDALQPLADLIETAVREDAPPAVNEGGVIKPGYNTELDELISIGRDGKGWLAKLEVAEKKATGINTLKVRYNKVFGYYIEIPRSQSGAAPAHYVRKQTLVNAERYITDELKKFENRVLGAQERQMTLEYELFRGLREEVVKHHPQIQAAARFLARLDCLTALAALADQNNYARPRINAEGRISIEDGRHPVIEKMIAGERFVPNSIVMDNDTDQVLIITGPNMAGKSTVLRQVAILALMTQMGSFVPAGKASMCVLDRIFTRVGALDNLSHGQSTFMVEMQETANILNNAAENSLVILDEIGRGTSTFDGLSIAWAVAEYLHDLRGRGVKTLFATHYHELTELARTLPRVKNYNIAVKEWNDKIIFLRKLVEGGANRSYGIQVARLAGIPEAVIKRSKDVLATIEENKHNPAASALPRQVKTAKKKGHVQLRLFAGPEDMIMETLQNLDITQMTPVDALNCLNDLLEKSKTAH